MIIFAISIFLGILSVVNKIWLYQNRQVGWISGMVIGIVSGFYFYVIGLQILALAEVGFFSVMLYGALFNFSPTDRAKIAINILLTVLTLIFFWFLYRGSLTTIQLASSVSFIWGGYLLTSRARWSGWALLVVAHISTSKAAFDTGQEVFAYLQIISAFVCMFAIVSTKTYRGRGSPSA